MRQITITANDSGRRLDRFLRKYLPRAALGEVYKAIRKDVKVDGKRRDESYILNEGEILTLYLTDEELRRFGAADAALAGSGPRTRSGPGNLESRKRAKRTFSIVYEDDNVLIAGKPFGLLTHGDSYEKKDHLANQVKDYLIETGAFDPRNEKVFVPAPVNRLDRNTTGIVLFGKTAAAMRELSRMIREDDIRKFYLTIACGEITEDLRLGGSLVKDEASNKVRIIDDSAANVRVPDGAKTIKTIVRPLEVLTFDGLKATLCEVELVTGRSHQIRAHLADAGHPLIGDSKYAGSAAGHTESRSTVRNKRPAEGPAAINRYIRDRFGLTTQLLHAGRIEFHESSADYEALGYLAGKAFDAPVPKRFREILDGLGGRRCVI